MLPFMVLFKCKISSRSDSILKRKVGLKINKIPNIVRINEKICEIEIFSLRKILPNKAVIIMDELHKVSASLASKYFNDSRPNMIAPLPTKPLNTRSGRLCFGPRKLELVCLIKNAIIEN